MCSKSPSLIKTIITTFLIVFIILILSLYYQEVHNYLLNRITPIQLTDWITLSAVLVALFGHRIWDIYDNYNKKKEIKAIITSSLTQLKSDLIRIRDERNTPENDGSRIKFDSTSFSEVNGYYFLYSELLLPNFVQIELSNYMHTLDFFNHYKINMETIRARAEEKTCGDGHLTLATVNKLLKRLDNAMCEFG